MHIAKLVNEKVCFSAARELFVLFSSIENVFYLLLDLLEVVQLLQSL